MKGLFIVFEGIDGAGKSTQVQRLVSALQAQGRTCHGTFEPTLGPVGAVLRQYLQKRVSLETRSLPYLFAADRSDHLYNEQNGIEATLQRGVDVICDRYILSNIAYQGDATSLELVLALNEHFLTPDLTFYLRVAPEQGLALKSRQHVFADVTETVEQQRKAAAQFELAISRVGAAHQVVEIDAWSLGIDGCAEVVLSHTLDLLRVRGTGSAQ